jgi:hypothetical protein
MGNDERCVCMRCGKWHMRMVRAIDQSNDTEGYLCLKCIVECGK